MGAAHSLQGARASAKLLGCKGVSLDNRRRSADRRGATSKATTMSTTTADSVAGGRADPAGDEAVFSKVSWRIMPLLVICYFTAYLDRIDIGYAQLQMKQTLPFSDAVYGLGAGIFFVGYFLFEVPSNRKHSVDP